MSLHRENLRKRIKRLEQQKQRLNHRGPLLSSALLILANSPAHARALEQGLPHRLLDLDEPGPPDGIVGVISRAEDV